MDVFSEINIFYVSLTPMDILAIGRWFKGEAIAFGYRGEERDKVVLSEILVYADVKIFSPSLLQRHKRYRWLSLSLFNINTMQRLVNIFNRNDKGIKIVGAIEYDESS